MHESMFNGDAVIGILAQQSHIASVQSCDDARGWRTYNLRGQTRSECVRHRIMNMKKIELLRTCHFRHFHCERQGVVGTWKQCIVRNIDSMEMKALLRQTQPHWLRITEKINFMTAPRQF